MSTTTEVKSMLSYHGDESIKQKYIARMQAHMDADELMQGVGFEKNGVTRGCAIGCTLDRYDHKGFEIELGIPRILARLEDRIFEGLSVEDSKGFPIVFLRAIPVGADLSNIYKKFFIWMLVDAADGVIKFAKKEATKVAITNVANLLGKSLLEKVTSEEFREVTRAARSDAAAYAAYAAAYAAYAAAYAAYAADDAAAADRKKYFKKMADKLIELLAAA